MCLLVTNCLEGCISPILYIITTVSKDTIVRIEVCGLTFREYFVEAKHTSYGKAVTKQKETFMGVVLCDMT